eukprot:TRINITY_DN43655_c0_g1_i1.p1 TRINITY_DN43655_c0_g1~~TRINITY_DN43655_c0_g1_i1.p1  ORF type:complete len:263 (-),score=56.94 TRINITY_DN43655_c0_g1_i1:39-827(-)
MQEMRAQVGDTASEERLQQLESQLQRLRTLMKLTIFVSLVLVALAGISARLWALQVSSSVEDRIGKLQSSVESCEAYGFDLKMEANAWFQPSSLAEHGDFTGSEVWTVAANVADGVAQVAGLCSAMLLCLYLLQKGLSWLSNLPRNTTWHDADPPLSLQAISDLVLATQLPTVPPAESDADSDAMAEEDSPLVTIPVPKLPCKLSWEFPMSKFESTQRVIQVIDAARMIEALRGSDEFNGPLIEWRREEVRNLLTRADRWEQ